MGPTIILDKSALQAFSLREVGFLFKHYYVVITPVLISEILGDLAKGPKNAGLSEVEVRHLAGKLLSVDSVVNVHYRHPCLSSLVGYSVPMDGRALVPEGIPVEAPGLGRGLVLDQTDIRGMLCDWQQGIFSDEDRAKAKRWRETIKRVNVQGLRERIKSLLPDMPKIRDVQHLTSEVEKLASNLDHEFQLRLIRASIASIGGTSQKVLNEIFQRWHDEGLPVFKRFAPYAFHCLEADLLFYIGLACGLFSARSSNLIDLEYIYYLPFCMIFCSGDEFQKDICHLFLRKDQAPPQMNQQFIGRDELKSDLCWLADEWDSLSEPEKACRNAESPWYPPENPQSVTCRMWDKLMRPRPQPGSPVSRMSVEETLRVLEKLRPALEAIRKKDQKGQGA
jgi:hypothetical protein